VVRGQGVVANQQLFVQLLAWAQASDFDLNVPVGVGLFQHRQSSVGRVGRLGERLLQVLSLSLFEVKPLAELLGARLLKDDTEGSAAQLCLSQKSPDSNGSDPN
jgi:hypothetical protein